MNYSEKPYKFIYNRTQAMFFINNGAFLIDSDVNNKTGNVYFQFKNDEKLQDLFNEWCNRKH